MDDDPISSASSSDEDEDEERIPYRRHFTQPRVVADDVLPPQSSHPQTSYGTWIQCEDAKWRLRADVGENQLLAIQIELTEARNEPAPTPGARDRAAAEIRNSAARAALARAHAPEPEPEPEPEPRQTIIPACSICKDKPVKMTWKCGHAAACVPCTDTIRLHAGGTARIKCPLCQKPSTPIELFM